MTEKELPSPRFVQLLIRISLRRMVIRRFLEDLLQHRLSVVIISVVIDGIDGQNALPFRAFVLGARFLKVKEAVLFLLLRILDDDDDVLYT